MENSRNGGLRAPDEEQSTDWRIVPKQESVATQLRDRIIGGHYPLGHHLMEVPIAEELGVSRTPVRDALTLLSQEGLVEPGPKRGYKVRTFTLEEILQAYEVRGALEGMACRVLAEQGLAPETRDIIGKCLAIGDQLLATGPFTEDQHGPWLEMNNTFHASLSQAPKNRMLAGFIEQSQKVPLASARHVHWYKIDMPNFELAKRAHTDHHEIFDAIVRRQSARAEARMREHIYFSQQLVANQFSEFSDPIGFDTLQARGTDAPA
jgi:GntR family transcriptional regulator, vanillate catabolism transcriptional regulator